MRSQKLSLCPSEEIKKELKPQGVTKVKRVTIKRDDKIIQTNTYILTFYLPTITHTQKKKKLATNDELHRPFILLGNFDSHNTPVCGGEDRNKKGQILEKIINENDMGLLSNGALTYVNPSRGNHSAIDLTICNPPTTTTTTVYMNFTWKVYDDTCGSYHFPILIKSTEPRSEKILHWKLDKANWEIFKEKCKNKLTHIETNHDIVAHFTETLTEIAKDCVPRNSTLNKCSRPLFDYECQKVIRLRRVALKKFQKEPTT